MTVLRKLGQCHRRGKPLLHQATGRYDGGNAQIFQNLGRGVTIFVERHAAPWHGSMRLDRKQQQDSSAGYEKVDVCTRPGPQQPVRSQRLPEKASVRPRRRREQHTELFAGTLPRMARALPACNPMMRWERNGRYDTAVVSQPRFELDRFRLQPANRPGSCSISYSRGRTGRSQHRPAPLRYQKNVRLETLTPGCRRRPARTVRVPLAEFRQLDRLGIGVLLQRLLVLADQPSGTGRSPRRWCRRCSLPRAGPPRC